MVNVTSPAPPPGKPRGNLESYSFPTTAQVNEDKSWSLTIHNNGDAGGEVAAGIGNLGTSPGDIIVTYAGREYRISPGYILFLYRTMNPCERINPSGTVRFLAEGEYTIRLAGAHREDTRWIIDTFKDVG